MPLLPVPERPRPAVRITSVPSSSSGTISGVVTNPAGSVSGLTVTVKRTRSGTTATLGTAATDAAGAWSCSVSGLSDGDELVATVGAPVSGRHGVSISMTADEQFVASLPSGAIGVWVADTYSVTPQPHLQNLVAPAGSTVSANLLRGGPNQSGIYWQANNCTPTDRQIGPDGTSTTATRVVGTTSNPYYSYTGDGSWTPGIYTLAFEARTRAGSDQTFKSAFLSGGSTSGVKNVTSAWQTFVHTGNMASSGSIIPLWSSDGATAFDIDIANIRLFAGSIDFGPDPAPVGHLLLGRTPLSGVPGVSGGAMNMSNSCGVAMIDGSLSAVTAVAIAQKNTAGKGSNYQAFLSKGATSSNTAPYGEFTAYFEQNGGTRAIQGGFANASGSLWELYGQGWHFFAHTHDSNGAKFYIDDVQFAFNSTPLTSFSFNSLLVGNLNNLNQPFSANYNIAAIALFNRALSRAEIDTTRSVLATRVASSGISLGTERIFVAEGDSLTEPSNSYAHLFGENDNPAVLGSVFAVSGSAIGDLNNRAPLADAQIPISPGSRKFILSVMIGRNGLSTSYSGPGGTGVSGWLADLAAYLDARRAKGWKVVLCTILPSTAAGFNEARNAANTTMRTWVGVHCDALADMAADPTVGIDGDGSASGPWNTTYYYDGNHLTAAGQVRLEPYLRAAVNSL